MRHLYNCHVAIERLAGTMVNGTPNLSWTQITEVIDPSLPAGQMWCRLDLTFLRPGKDQPAPLVAGRALDRVGVCFFNPTTAVAAGDRIRTVAGPVAGTFEIRSIPDPAIAMRAAHHMEVQVIEVAQGLTGVFPAGVLDS